MPPSRPPARTAPRRPPRLRWQQVRRRARAPQVERRARPPSSGRKLLGWLGGIGSAVVLLIVTNAVTGFGSQLVNLPALFDRVSRTPAVKADVVPDMYQEVMDLAVPGELHPTAAERRIMVGDDPNRSLDSLWRDLVDDGAYRLMSSYIAITIRGERSEPVQITNVRPVITSHAAPPAGTVISIASQGGGPDHYMGIDLDAPVPGAREIDGPRLGGPYFAKNIITLNKNETDKIVIKATALRAAYTFTLAIDYRVGDDTGSVRVDDSGHPFHFSGFACTGRDVATYQHGYQLGSRSHRLILVPTASPDRLDLRPAPEEPKDDPRLCP
jgi:hypothetical protein